MKGAKDALRPILLVVGARPNFMKIAPLIEFEEPDAPNCYSTQANIMTRT